MKLFEKLPEGFNLVKDEISYKLTIFTFAQAFGDSHYPVPAIDIGTRAYTKINFENCKAMVDAALSHEGYVLANEDFSAAMCITTWKNRAIYPLEEIIKMMENQISPEAIQNFRDVCGYICEYEPNLTYDDDALYIECFAVQTPLQGQKLGSKLMRKLFEEADRVNKDLILFTNTDKNSSIYLHFGFEITKKLVREDLNSVTYFMVRHPNQNK